jgi:hypothetical protein
LIKVADDVGIKPSTALMFDHLVFVEGPSDEDVLLDFAKKLQLDLRAANVAFVRMGGATRFSHFAAESMLDLLSRRRVGMTFLLDRDERELPEVEKMLARAGDRARVKVLKRRELENYLLNPEAVLNTLQEKARTTREGTLDASPEQVRDSIKQFAEGGLEALIHLRLVKKILQPIFPNQFDGDVKERLESAATSLQKKAEDYDEVEVDVRKEAGLDWPKNAQAVVPGSYILKKVFESFGFKYRKEVDAARIAKYLGPDLIDPEIRTLLKEALGNPV